MSSIRERIMQLVKAKLETITTGNGYNNTINTVERTRTTPVNKSEMPCIFIYEDGESVSAIGGTVNLGLYENQLSLILECWIKDDSTEKGTQLNALLEDVIKAMQENYSWTDGGGTCLAVDTQYQGNQTLLEFASAKGNGFLALLVNFNIIYRTKFGDLTSLA